MLFGRAFEQALAAYFRREDVTEALFKAWAVHQGQVPVVEQALETAALMLGSTSRGDTAWR
jgi:hypothetical protein